MKLNVVTVADDLSRADDAELIMKSYRIALVVLADDVDYFDDLQNAAKIRKYRKTINTEALPLSTQQIIQAKMKEASYAEREAAELLKEAVLRAHVAVDGSIVNVRATKPADVFDQALSKLADAIFTKADCIADPAKTDEDIRATLRGASQMALDGQSSQNARAEKEVADFLHAQSRLSLNTTMGDLQRKFQGAPMVGAKSTLPTWWRSWWFRSAQPSRLPAPMLPLPIRVWLPSCARTPTRHRCASASR